jgi:hypothetical protein
LFQFIVKNVQQPARKAEGIPFGSGQRHFLRMGAEQLEPCSCMRVAAIKVNQLPPAILKEAVFLAEADISHKLGILPSISNNFHMHSLYPDPLAISRTTMLTQADSRRSLLFRVI